MAGNVDRAMECEDMLVELEQPRTSLSECFPSNTQENRESQLHLTENPATDGKVGRALYSISSESVHPLDAHRELAERAFEKITNTLPFVDHHEHDGLTPILQGISRDILPVLSCVGRENFECDLKIKSLDLGHQAESVLDAITIGYGNVTKKVVNQKQEQERQWLKKRLLEIREDFKSMKLCVDDSGGFIGEELPSTSFESNKQESTSNKQPTDVFKINVSPLLTEENNTSVRIARDDQTQLCEMVEKMDVDSEGVATIDRLLTENAIDQNNPEDSLILVSDKFLQWINDSDVEMDDVSVPEDF